MTALTVGAALSQTGMYALQGQQALQGLRLWVDDTNARGGLFVPELHRAVALRLIAYDDHSRRSDVERLTEHQDGAVVDLEDVSECRCRRHVVTMACTDPTRLQPSVGPR